MKRLGLFFVALVAALSIGGGAIAATADAAFCSAGTDTMITASTMTAWLHQCTDITAVRFKFSVPPGGTDEHWYGGVWDAGPPPGGGVNAYRAYYIGSPTGTSDITVPTNPCSNCGVSVQYFRNCNTLFSGTHILQPHFWYQIQGRQSGQWGPLHEYQSPQLNYMTCP